MAGFVDFDKLTPHQQHLARIARPSWKDEQFYRVAFWVTANGKVSRKPGQHALTAAAAAELDKLVDKTFAHADEWVSTSFLGTSNLKH